MSSELRIILNDIMLIPTFVEIG